MQCSQEDRCDRCSLIILLRRSSPACHSRLPHPPLFQLLINLNQVLLENLRQIQRRLFENLVLGLDFGILGFFLFGGTVFGGGGLCQILSKGEVLPQHRCLLLLLVQWL